MTFDPKLVIWLVAALLAIVSLAKLMSTRQANLVKTLNEYVNQQLEWNRKRAKAARMAQKLAREKAVDEAKRTEQESLSAGVGEAHFVQFPQEAATTQGLQPQSTQKAA